MNRNLQGYYVITLLIFSVSIASAQRITVNNTASLENLVETLIDGCVEVSNVSSSINGSSHGITSYGEFNQGSSNFPFENGILLSTGSITSVTAPGITTPLSEGAPAWGSDADLEAILGVANTLNATSIEFDIVSISDQLQFNYIFASEEYMGTTCDYSDRFAFLIREGTAPYQNIALVPGTFDPVNTQTIRPQAACPAVNENYFAGYNTGETNFEGRTTVLTAATTIVPGETYHIKLVIADQTDEQYDSAVFIQGTTIKPVDLGPDITACSPTVRLDSNINIPGASFKWFRNGNEIETETNPTLNATQSGLYQVEVSLAGIRCTDEINVTLGSDTTIVPITDFYLCDFDGDGEELFDLSTRNSDIITNNPTIITDNNLISYHPSLADARDNTGTITTAVSNRSNPVLVHIRVEDSNGCIGYTSMNLIVDVPPTMPSNTSFDFCVNDTEPAGFTTIDLTQYDDDLTGMDPDLVVSYHDDDTQATNGDNPFTTYDYNNGDSSPLTIHIRLSNTLTGCFETAPITIEILEKPDVATERVFLNACEAVNGMDGFEVFDLRDALDAIFPSPTVPLPTSFHESEEDAESGSNAISSPGNYQNTVRDEQTVYVRVEGANGCFTIVPIEIHTNLLLTGTNLGEFAICNTEDEDTLDFDLSAVEAQIANNLPNNITVRFFESENDYENDNSITGPTVPVDKDLPKTLFIEINDDTNCPRTAEITLLINPVLIFEFTTLTYCDNDSDVNDDTIMVDLTSYDSRVTGGLTDFSVSYFLHETDAENNVEVNRLPDLYEVTNSATIYARIVSDIDSRCAGVSEFKIEVMAAPEVLTPDPLLICDINDGITDGLVTIPLNDIIPDIVSDPSQFRINFYSSWVAAKSETDPILNRTSFLTSTQTVYVRVDNTECYKIVPYNITVNTEPIIPNIQPLLLCTDDDTQPVNFVLADKDAEILDGQIGKEVHYFFNQTQADDPSLSDAINKTDPVLLGNQEIYIRVVNISDPTCAATGSFTVIVSANPVFSEPTPFFECENVAVNGQLTFNLNDKIAEIRQGIPNPNDLKISFHKTETEFQALAGEFPLQLQYTKNTSSETLYVRIQSISTQCVVVRPLNIIIWEAPKLSDAQPLAVCDTYTDFYDGTAVFNLREADFTYLDNRPQATVLHYFEQFEDINQEDVLDNSLAIPDAEIENYISDSKTIYIKAMNTRTYCFTVIPLELVVNAPPRPNTIDTVALCDNDTNTQDLSIVEAMLLNDPTVANFNFYTDANFSIPIPDKMFTYTTIGDFPIYVRITNRTSLCDITTSFNLRIKETPVANTPPDLVACDDDFDGELIFDLSQNDGAILGVQDPSIHTITYHNSLANAEAGIALGSSYNAVDGEIIYARLENTNTQCPDFTQFTIIVNPLPIIPINDVVPLCINDLPLIIDASTGNPNDTYLWSTGETTSQIALGLGDAGDDYWVTVTRTYVNAPTCEVTKPFSVIESSIADINFTATVDFSDPNSITVDVSGIGDYVYILDGGEPQESNVFENVTLGNHIVTVRDLYGCDDISKEVTVFDIPKFVTPNNDGYFDTWHVVDFRQLPGTIVYIYDRYGKLLKTLPHTSPGWDGTYNGYNMPSDDYWFVANIIQEGNAFTIKGHFALKR